MTLKVAPDGVDEFLKINCPPDIVCFTAVTCEANTVLKLAEKIKDTFQNKSPLIVIGGHHASLDPEYFNRICVDYVVAGLAKLSFRQLVDALSKGQDGSNIPGVARTRPGKPLILIPRKYGF